MDSDIEELFARHHANDAGFCRHYLTLYSIVLGMETQNAFEFGSGYSTKAILKALEHTGGRLTTCDIRPIEETSIFFDVSYIRNSKNWRGLQKNSLAVVNDIANEKFDLVFHDGAHRKDIVQKDMENIFPKMKLGSLFLLHDTNHPLDNYNLKEAIDNISKRWKVSHVTLPYGYGLTIMSIEEDFGNGAIEIKWRKNR